MSAPQFANLYSVSVGDPISRIVFAADFQHKEPAGAPICYPPAQLVGVVYLATGTLLQLRDSLNKLLGNGSDPKQ